jgi:hypothetical protein
VKFRPETRSKKPVARGLTPETIGIVLIKELNWTKIYHTTFATYLWDMTLDGVF